MGRNTIKVFAFGAAAGCLALASAAGAQSARSAGCEAVVAPLAADQEARLQVICGDRGVILGEVDSHRLLYLPALRSALVITTLNGSDRAWLVMRADDGGIALEDITGTISRLAGRGARDDIDGVEIDLDALNRGQATAAIKAPGGAAGVLDIGALVANARAIRGKSTAQD